MGSPPASRGAYAWYARLCPDEQHEAGGEERLIEERRRKLDELRAAGTDPFPYDFPDRTAVADVLDRHAGLADGEETDETVGWPAA